MRKTKLAVLCLITALVATLAVGAAVAQQATTDIWKLVPPDSLAVAACDTRPDNASIRAIASGRDPQSSEILAKQRAAMRRAIEDFATLFGVSLDFAKDIDPWNDQQWAFLLLPGEKNSPQPVFLIASKDATAASATMQKMLEPWGRIGELTPELDSDFPITAFKTKENRIQVYASAFGPVVAIATSKDSLKQALKGGGFAAGSTAEKAFTALSGSVFYAYADASLMNLFGIKPDTIPINGLGVGASAIDTGMKLRVLGYPNESGITLLKQMLPDQQAGSLLANPGVPSASLVAASLPNLAGPVAMAGGMGMAKVPMFGAALAASKMQISGALTAVFPKPAWVISGMAESPEAAVTKRAEIEASLKEAKMPVQPAANGMSSVQLSEDKTMYLSQAGKHVLFSDDARSLTSSAAVIDGKQPSIVESKTYQETMAGLGDSNLMTLYANLAPIQGLGFLAEGLGVTQWIPLYDSLAKSLQSVQSLGIGTGFDGEVVSATVFLRAKPGMATTIGPAAIAGTAVGAAVLFPVFARARDTARASSCMADMKQLTMAAIMYAQDNNGKLPTMTNWQTQLKAYTHKPISEIQCPVGGSHYAINKNLAGLSLDRIQNPSDKVLFFETFSPNNYGSRADAVLVHGGEGNFAFADTHVEKLREVPEQAQWVPAVAQKTVKKAPVKKPVVRKRARN